MCFSSCLFLQVLKLNALGYKPILFLGHHDRKGQIIGDVIHHVEPADGVVQEILIQMRELYEHLLRSKMSFVLRYDILHCPLRLSVAAFNKRHSTCYIQST